MATVQQAKQEAQSARQQLAQRQSEVQTASEQLSQTRQKLQSQQVLRQLKGSSGRGSAIQGRLERQKISAQVGEKLNEVRSAKEILSDFEEKQLKPYESEIQRVEEQQKKAEEAKRDLDVVQEIVSGERPTSDAKTGQQKKFLNLLSQGKQASVQEAISDIESQANMTLSSDIREKLAKEYVQSGTAKLDLNGGQFSTSARNINLDLPSIIIKDLPQTNLPSVTSQSNMINPQTGRPYSIIKLPEKTDFITSLKNRLRSSESGMAKEAGLSALGAASAVYDLVKSPIELGKLLSTGFKTKREIEKGLASGTISKQDLFNTATFGVLEEAKSSLSPRKLGADYGASLRSSTGSFTLGKTLTNLAAPYAIGKAFESLTVERIVSKAQVPETKIINLGKVKTLPDRSLTQVKVAAYTPERTVQVQSTFSRLIGKEPKTITISPEQLRYGVVTGVSNEGELIGNIAIRRKGGKLVEFYPVRSSTGEINIQNINQLTSTERRLLLKGLGDESGVVASIDSSSFFRSSSQVENIMRITPEGKSFKVTIKPAGRRIDRFATISKVDKLPGKPYGDMAFIESPNQYLSVRSASTDITMSQKGGKIIRGKGLTVLEDSGASGVGSNVDQFKVISSGQKSIQRAIKDTNLENIAKNILSDKSKQLVFKSSSKTIQSLDKPVSTYPKIVSGITGFTSAYTGKGSYELQTTQVISPNLLTTSLSQSRVSDRLGSSQTQIQKSIPTVASSVTSSFRSKTKLNVFQPVLQKESPSLSQPTLTKINQIQPTKSVQRESPGLAQPTKQTTTTRPPIDAKPKPKVIPPKLARDTLARRMARRLTSSKSIFEVFTKKKGKDVSIGKFGTKESAEKALFKELKSTLRASGKIKEGERTLGLGELGGKFKTKEFRAGKSDSGQIVQRRGFRLGTRGETSEAQFFRGKSKKSKSRFGL